MLVGKDDLGLSLSLSIPQNQQPLNLNLKHNFFDSVPSSSTSSALCLSRPSWNDASSRDPNSDAFFRGIDVNRFPSNTDCEDEAGVSSPNSTVSSASLKRSEREENEAERACSRGVSDEEDGDVSKKKLRLSKDQSAVLEECFKEHNTLNPKQKLALAKRLGLRPRQVEVWFQNRRARTKLKQTEVDCEYLRRCCETLTEENRRLQKEVAELRALKTPQLYMHMTPPTTLTMCPSCERVAAAPSSASSAAAVDHHRSSSRVVAAAQFHRRPVHANHWLAGGVQGPLRPRS